MFGWHRGGVVVCRGHKARGPKSLGEDQLCRRRGPWVKLWRGLLNRVPENAQELSQQNTLQRTGLAGGARQQKEVLQLKPWGLQGERGALCRSRAWGSQARLPLITRGMGFESRCPVPTPPPRCAGTEGASSTPSHRLFPNHLPPPLGTHSGSWIPNLWTSCPSFPGPLSVLLPPATAWEAAETN